MCLAGILLGIASHLASLRLAIATGAIIKESLALSGHHPIDNTVEECLRVLEAPVVLIGERCRIV